MNEKKSWGLLRHSGVNKEISDWCGFKIGKNTFIGMKCYLDDLCVDKIETGNNSVIGAKSLVNKDIPANAVAYGVPVEVVREED